jgi:hypothetical protein
MEGVAERVEGCQGGCEGRRGATWVHCYTGGAAVSVCVCVGGWGEGGGRGQGEGDRGGVGDTGLGRVPAIAAVSSCSALAQ